MNTEEEQVRQDAKAMLELLSTPDHWTQGVYARDANGESVDPVDPAAVCWCAVGAAYKVVGSSARSLPVPRLLVLERAIVTALHRRQPAYACGYIITVNDSVDGYDTVMRALREIVGRKQHERGAQEGVEARRQGGGGTLVHQESVDNRGFRA